MKTSLMSPIKKTLTFIAVLALIGPVYGFKAGIDELELLNWSNKCLSESYAPVIDAKLKKWEINLTNDHFLRLRKTYQHGRQEYFSFNLQRLNDVEYMGNDTTGTLEFTTMADDIIVQTYEDPKGDIDSMSTVLELPVKNMSPARLDSLKTAFNYFKTKSL